MSKPFRWQQSCLAGLSLLMSTGLPAFSLTSLEITNAVRNADQIPNPVSVKIDHSTVSVSTFLIKEKTENDFKIGAALIAKTVMALAPDEVARVTVYFYNTTLTKCKSVTVTAGDVKAFGAGELNKDQLLSALVVRDERMSDTSSNVDTFLQARERSNDYPVHTKINGPVMELSTQIEPWIKDKALKLEALRIADKALQVASPSVQKIVISFADTADANKVRQVPIDVPTLVSLHNNMETLLQPVPIVEITLTPSYQSFGSGQRITASIDVQALQTVPGPAQDDRKIVLDRIKDLDRRGIGVEPFIDAFITLEENAKNGEDQQVTDGVAALSSRLEEQEKAHKEAKDFHPTKPGAAPTQATQSRAVASDLDDIRVWDRKEGEYPPEITNAILSNPKAAMAEYRQPFLRGGHTPDYYPAYLKLVRYFGKTLRANNRIAEAEIYEKEAAGIVAKRKAQAAN